MRIDFIQKLIDTLRGKCNGYAKIAQENDIKIPKELLKKVKLNINGKNNSIIIKNAKISKHGKIVINICGDNNKVVIENGFSLSNKLELLMGQNHPNFGKITNSTFTVCENTSMVAVHYITFNSNTYCNIGKQCMFAFDIVIHNTDAHPIFDLETKQVINRIKGITIGDHCWIGRGVAILKNSVVPDDCIVGMNAVYSGNPAKNGENDFQHCAFAGNPAKLVKRNITWDTNGAKCGYIANIVEENEK